MKASSNPSLGGLYSMSPFWLSLALLPVLAAGCAGTFHQVRTVSPSQPPAERPTVLVLGKVQIIDTNITPTANEVYRLKFQEGIEAWFGKTNVFESVVLDNTN